MNLEELLERALTQADDGDWEGMAELFRDHLQEFEEEPAVQCWLGVAERELGMEGVAYERFRRAITLGTEDPYILATAGSALAAFDDPDAETALRTAALLAPQLPLARLMYGAYLAREGFQKEALVELQAARELDPDDALTAFELGVARMIGGDAEGAADAMGDAVSLEPEDAWYRATRGLVLLEAGRMEEAAAELTEGAHLSPEDVEAQMLAALAAAVIGSHDLSYEMLERGRMRALEGDIAMVSAVEDRLDDPEEARSMLVDALGPDALRRRLQERP